MDRLPDLGIGIRVKLVALMVAMITVVVAGLTAYFIGREIGELRTAAHDRALVYAGLAGQQLRSAVAFEDRETAREVLGALARDPLVEGIAVYDARGTLLHAEGRQTDLARTARSVRSGKPAGFYLPGRILATASVESLEGARGTVVLELSTRGATEMRKRLLIAALWIGSVALGFGVAIAWLIARSLARRIERVAAGASAMSSGQLDHAIDVSGPNDEIGLLSHGFNAMSRKVRDLVAHIQRTAKEESSRLEHLVVQRTVELDRKNKDLRLVLDNVEQGFVTIDRQALVVGEYSLAVKAWFGDLNPNESLWQQLARDRDEQTQTFAVAWEQVIDGVLPLELTLGQMPRRIELGGRHLSFEYLALGGENFDKMLVVISDVSAVVAREESEQEVRELVSLTTHFLKDRQGFTQFFAESKRLIESISTNTSDQITLKRDLHTLKGNGALFGLSRVSRACHELESALQEQLPGQIDRTRLLSYWEQCCATVERLLGQRSGSTIEVAEQQYQELLAAIRRGAPPAELERKVRTWRLEPMKARLESIAEQLISLATSLGKGSVAVKVRTPELYLGREELGEFWAAFSHVVRNAAVHGLKQARGASAASQEPDFDIRAGIEQDSLFVEIADFGPGIDWEGVRARATAHGLPHQTAADLEEALFVDGISTRVDVTDLAGRGVGLGAVRQACARRKGNICIVSKHGGGTRFRFSWPVSQFQTLVRLQDGAAA